MARGGMAEQLTLGDHICALVDGTGDGLDVMAQTVAAGLDAGDKVMIFTESLPPVAVRAAIEHHGVTASAAEQAGQVQVLPARTAYLADGRFEPARMLDSLVGHIDHAGRDGYRGLRLVGDMTWALTEPARFDQLAGYEAQVNQLYLDGRALGVCLYDRRAFPRDLLRQVTCAHPASAGAGVATGWAPLLRIRRTTDPHGLRLIGEADLSNRQALAAALDAVADRQTDPAAPILIDVTELRFADAATAALLGQLALRTPAGVHLAGAQPALKTVLDRLGVTQLSRMRLVPAIGGTGRTRTEMVE